MIKMVSLAPYTFLPARTGGHKGIALFYKYLCRKVSLTCISTVANQGEHKGYELIKLLSTSGLRYINPLLLIRIRKLVKEKEAGFFLVEHPYMGWLGFGMKKTTAACFVVHSHNIEGLRFKDLGRWWWRILLAYEGWVHRQAHLSFFKTDEDKAYAVRQFRLNPQRCHTLTFGTEKAAAPAATDKQAAKEKICREHGIPPTDTILLFNGALNYLPNVKAVDIILNMINPALQQQPQFAYKIFICGGGLSGEAYSRLLAGAEPDMICTGFVPDIELYLMAADLFINPVTEGGGIKTKLVEALAFSNTVVTTASGATGVPLSATGSKMKVVADGDWPAFVEAIVKADADIQINPAFFENFYWESIVEKAVRKTEALS